MQTRTETPAAPRAHRAGAVWQKYERAGADMSCR
jgi:hypothetical protein